MSEPRMLGTYRLVEKLGAGGMGVVWRAVDTTLDREVAVKILPDAVSRQPGRLERFEREAKVLASLQHPNIAILYGLHQEGDERFLAMELVDGEDLSKRLRAGPLATTDALKLCAQVARALEAAHARNIVHRDLKPANVVLTSSGEAKVLDFGLAKVLDPDSPDDEDVTSTPTVTTGGTRVGAILGTAAYMSPEQARGKPTDRRTDVWSFGCVLYECLTGVSEFRGDTMSDSIGAILHKSPDWNALPADVPANVRWLLKRCLAKDRDNRLHDIADARIELEQAIVDPEAAGELASAERAAAPRRPWLLPAAVALTVLVAGAGAWLLKPAPAADLPLVVLSFELPVPQENLDFAFSPDGTAIVYREIEGGANEDGETTSRLWLRRLDSFVPVPIAGTEDGDMPTFSPDGKTVAYVVDRDGGAAHQADLRVVGLDGRPPLTVATDAVDHGRPHWLSADELLYVDHQNENLLHVVSRGGDEPRTWAELPDESKFSAFGWDVYDGGRWLITNTFTDAQPTVVMIETATGKETLLARDVSSARLLPDGTLLFVRGGALLAARIDVSGDVPKFDGDVRTVMTGGTGADDKIQSLEASAAGHVAFVTGEGAGKKNRLMTLDRDGNVASLVEAQGPYVTAGAFSSDGKLLVVSNQTEESPSQVWVIELDTGARRPMAPGEAVAFGGTWLPGNRLAFTAWKSVDQGRILVREMRRGAEPEPLFDNWPEGAKLGGVKLAFDGKNVAFDSASTGYGGAMDILIQPLDGSEPPRELVATPAYEAWSDFSPDGKWLVYMSNESGRNEVYVRAHSADGTASGEPIKVSRRGGQTPLWSPTGKEIFYFWGKKMFGVDFEPGDRPRLSEPYVLVEDADELRARQLFDHPRFVPMPDGKRLAFVQGAGETPKIGSIEVVLHWASALER